MEKSDGVLYQDEHKVVVWMGGGSG